ncbi:plasma membrane proteolipid [Rhizoctonia solani]|uniref:Plasma membrane proteolipid n=1 Tax=Rhizoctonia solani TaxID=456999 RepID=A0A8H8NPZ8_9AGAM|nr:plasma membrane proteolipid [Rhizoctonia solani]QRW16187.1 plasma membrane proteolipid [Rhizoctonia solani]
MPPANGRYKIKPKRHHAYTVFIFVIGFLLPPFAVAARFGIGKDFWINVLLTICGYVPGQIHNFYIQTIRDNKNSRRTPQWALKHGLVDDSSINRRKKRKEWSHRYNDRLPQSVLDGAEFAPDQIPDSDPTPAPAPTVGGARSPAALWREDDSEGFYDRTKMDAPRETFHRHGSHLAGNKPKKGWRFDGGFPDEDAQTGAGGSIYTEPERKSWKKRSHRPSRQSSIDTAGTPRYGSRVWEDPLANGSNHEDAIVPRANGSTAQTNRVGDGLDHEF